ncbi:MAG: protocatechuate 3,4-dioxygenase [Pseudomonadota bacterium]|nr:protocatechuate 3,4-dioxygenase [Pseudomonadota bacterium]
MNDRQEQISRRRLVRAAAVSALASLFPGITLAALMPTPRQSRGPFYPDRLPLDRDNDLVRVEGRDGTAAGEITDLTGTVLEPNGRPVEGALVEIWQCDANGRYIHRGDERAVPRDPNFQGYGRFTTGADGRFRFRTIKPVPYPGRAPHIHFAVRTPGRDPFVTQMYVKGAPENQRDWLLNDILDDDARERLIVAFEPGDDPQSAPLKARFDIVLDF